MASIFSKIIQKEIPCYLIHENEHFIAFLDVFPLVAGHVLVVPKLEIDYVFDLSDELLSELMLFAKPIAAALKKAMPCNRIGLSVIGLEVPHAHLHLVPINSADDLNFTKPKLQLSADEMKVIQEKILKELHSFKHC
jgi:histidine triad (HIT) family protein